MRLIIPIFFLCAVGAFAQTAPVATCNAASLGKVAQTVNTGSFAGTGSSWICQQAPLGTYGWVQTGQYAILPPTFPTVAWQTAGGPTGTSCTYTNNGNVVYQWQGALYQCLSTNLYGQTTSSSGATGLQPPASGTNVLIQGSTGSSTTTAGTGLAISNALDCIAASASGTAYTCSTSPTFTPAAGSQVTFKSDLANTATSATLAVNGAAAAGIKIAGSTTLTVGQILASTFYTAVYDGTNWQLTGASGGGANAVTNPGTGASGNLPSFSDNTGKVIGDSGIASANVITSASAMSSKAVPFGQGTQVLAQDATNFSWDDSIQILKIGPSGSFAKIGYAQNLGYAGIWFNIATPSTNNYTFLGDGTNSFLNATTGGNIFFRINNTTIATITPKYLSLYALQGSSGSPTVAISGTGTCTLAVPTGTNISGLISVTGACTAATITLTWSGLLTYSTHSLCDAMQDRTQQTTFVQTGDTTTTATFTAAALVLSDVLQYGTCTGY